MTLLRAGGWLLVVLAVVPMALVVAMALWFQASPALLWIAIWTVTFAAAFAAGGRRGPRDALGLSLAVTAAFGLWWMTILPSNNRDWQPDVAELLTAEFDPDDPERVILHNVRNFEWQTPRLAVERWETREYEVNALESLDVILTWWSGPAIAHTMVSFGFSDGEHIVFSLGIRPEKGEEFSSVAGFFKTYELVLTGADERDAVRLRTSVQSGNRVVLYRIARDRAMIQELFREYLRLANELAEQPRFYRTIFDNCTTVIWKLVNRITPGLPLDYRVVLSGYLPGLLHDRSALDMRFSLDELTQMGLLSAEVDDDGTGVGFSAAIRAGLPPQ